MDKVVTITRSNKRKLPKKVKKLIKKLRDDYINLKKEYEQKIAYLHIQLMDKEYYLNSILDFMNCNFRSPWDRAVYTGYERMCKFYDD